MKRVDSPSGGVFSVGRENASSLTRGHEGSRAEIRRRVEGLAPWFLRNANCQDARDSSIIRFKRLDGSYAVAAASRYWYFPRLPLSP